MSIEDVVAVHETRRPNQPSHSRAVGHPAPVLVKIVVVPTFVSACGYNLGLYVVDEGRTNHKKKFCIFESYFF